MYVVGFARAAKLLLNVSRESRSGQLSLQGHFGSQEEIFFVQETSGAVPFARRTAWHLFRKRFGVP